MASCRGARQQDKVDWPAWYQTNLSLTDRFPQGATAAKNAIVVSLSLAFRTQRGSCDAWNCTPPVTARVLPTAIYTAICFLNWARRLECTLLTAQTSHQLLQRLLTLSNGSPRRPPLLPPPLPPRCPPLAPRAPTTYPLLSPMRHAPVVENQALRGTQQSAMDLLSLWEKPLSRTFESISQYTCRECHVLTYKYIITGGLQWR